MDISDSELFSSFLDVDISDSELFSSFLDVYISDSELFSSFLDVDRKAIINGSAEMKKSAKLKTKRTKLNHKTQKAVSTGSAILINELNANLTDWVEYAIAWNTN